MVDATANEIHFMTICEPVAHGFSPEDMERVTMYSTGQPLDNGVVCVVCCYAFEYGL